MSKILVNLVEFQRYSDYLKTIISINKNIKYGRRSISDTTLMLQLNINLIILASKCPLFIGYLVISFTISYGNTGISGIM